MTILTANSKRNRVVAFAPVYEAFTNIPFLLTGQNTILLPTTDEECFPDVDKLEELLDRDGKTEQSIAAVIINSPNNPSGAVYPSAIVQRITSIVSKYPKIGKAYLVNYVLNIK